DDGGVKVVPSYLRSQDGPGCRNDLFSGLLATPWLRQNAERHRAATHEPGAIAPDRKVSAGLRQGLVALRCLRRKGSDHAERDRRKVKGGRQTAHSVDDRLDLQADRVHVSEHSRRRIVRQNEDRGAGRLVSSSEERSAC